jgi:hypothetical protein
LEAYKRDAFGDRALREEREKGPKLEDLLPNDNQDKKKDIS